MSAGDIPPEMLAEIIERALRPHVGLPIEDIDVIAADVRTWIDGCPMRVVLMEGVLAGIRLGRAGTVPRKAVGAIASAIIAAGEEIERARRSAGGRKTADRASAKVATRRKHVLTAFEGMPQRLKDHPYSDPTMRRLQTLLTSSLGSEPSREMLAKDLRAVGVRPRRAKMGR